MGLPRHGRKNNRSMLWRSAAERIHQLRLFEHVLESAGLEPFHPDYRSEHGPVAPVNSGDVLASTETTHRRCGRERLARWRHGMRRIAGCSGSLVATRDGLHTLDQKGHEAAKQHAGRSVTAVVRDGPQLWAILDRAHVCYSPEGSGVTSSLEGVAATCIAMTDAIHVGSSEARLFRLTDGALEPLEAFDVAEGTRHVVHAVGRTSRRDHGHVDGRAAEDDVGTVRRRIPALRGRQTHRPPPPGRPPDSPGRAAELNLRGILP